MVRNLRLDINSIVDSLSNQNNDGSACVRCTWGDDYPCAFRDELCPKMSDSRLVKRDFMQGFIIVF